MTGRVTLIGAGPGAADLITVRGLRALQAADVVLYDALVAPALLEGLSAHLLFVGKRCGKHAMPQEEITALVARLAQKGLHVVRLKGGDPTVFGRGAEEAMELRELGIPVEIVPGISSSIAVPALAGIPVTHRGVADSVTVVTGHRRRDELGFSIPPFSPRRTIVLLMAVGTVDAWRGQMLELGYPPELPVAFVIDGASAQQRTVVTTLERAAEDAAAYEVRSPAVTVVGNVVNLREALAAEVAATPSSSSDLPLEVLACALVTGK